MKKIVSFILLLTMMLTLAACGGNSAAPAETAAPAEATEAPAETEAPVEVEVDPFEEALALLFPAVGAEPDYDGAIAAFTALANDGNADAMYYLGYIHDYCLNDRDADTAREWYEKAAAADANHAKANACLGIMERGGKKVSIGSDKTEAYFTAAAENGLFELGDDSSADAYLLAAICYENGYGIEQDYTAALECYQKAADAGCAFAMRSIAVMYENGRGVDKDKSAAVEWYTKAAEHGDAEAMFTLGSYCESGSSADRDYTKAMDWYLKAADEGHAEAMNAIAVMYDKARGVERDKDAANEWFQKAADAGSETAKVNLEIIKQQGINHE